jgi:hypothetical protein
MTQIDKEYHRSFVIEPTKLRRLMDTIHERFVDLPHDTISDRFRVFLDGQVEEKIELAEVLELDNSRKRRIHRLAVTCSAWSGFSVLSDSPVVTFTTGPEHQVTVDIGKVIEAPPPPGNKTMVVAVSVSSKNESWATGTLSAVEEQLERMWQNYVPQILSLTGLAVGCLLLLLLSILPAQESDPVLPLWLNNADLKRVEALVSGGRIVDDKELREVFSRQLRNLVTSERRRHTPVKVSARQLLGVGIPLALVIPCVFILLFSCYPAAVFPWGDAEVWYKNVLRRRRNLWTFILSVLVIGVLSNLLYGALSASFIGK